MSGPATRRIVIAGAGVAGLTAALAFASRGFEVRVFDRAPKLEEAGAGLQLSPNATRLLDGLGVLGPLRATAVRPEAVTLRDGRTLRELARIPLGDAATRRWGAPYLVAHRADLQNALLERIAAEPNVQLTLGSPVLDVAAVAGGVRVSVQAGSGAGEDTGMLLVGADGVHSNVRSRLTRAGGSAFGSEIAWRTAVPSDSATGRQLAAAVPGRVVTAFLRPGFHLIAYPVRAGAAVNLVAFTRAPARPGEPAATAAESARSVLERELACCAPPLRDLARTVSAWTYWPIHVVDARPPWTAPGPVALIGDAAHAMTPYAAQGAAMAIEDAVTLADAVAARPDDLGPALAAWESARRIRVAAVERRAAFNRFAWHAPGPIGLARNVVLAVRGGDSLAADMDWLYGWKPGPAA